MLESLFDNVAGPQVFSCEVCEIFRTPILKNICQRLLLYYVFPNLFECENIIFDVYAERQVTFEKITRKWKRPMKKQENRSQRMESNGIYESKYGSENIADNLKNYKEFAVTT